MLIQLAMVAAYIIAFVVINRLLKLFMARLGTLKQVGELRLKRLTRTLQIGLLALTLMAVSLTLGWGYSQIGVFLSSIFAILGVALFAQWSILSNITASLIIFFAFPYRVGDRVKVVDKDDDITGVIQEIDLFHVIIRRADGDLITYPTNLILQKAVIKLLGTPRPSPAGQADTPQPRQLEKQPAEAEEQQKLGN